MELDLSKSSTQDSTFKIMDHVDFTDLLTPERLKGLAITQSDFESAIKRVQPSAKREG